MPLSRRARRWLIALAVPVLLALAAAAVLLFLAQPQRLVPLLLSRAGSALGLELRVEGTPAYSLRPEPHLVLPGFSATLPGEAAPIFRAERVELALPWATLRSGGEDLTITRVVLIAPDADVAGIQRWLAARPAGDAPPRLPTLSNGLHIERGRLGGDGWSVENLELALPFLQEARPALLTVSGTWVDGDAHRAFATHLAATPHLGSEGLRLDPLDLDLRGESPLPTLSARGRVALGERLDLDLHGELAAWPADWPALPEALPASDAPFEVTLRYAGTAALEAPLAATLRRAETRLETELVPAALRAWLDAGMPGPLPPLRGHLSTPRLDFGGVVLHGVEVELREDAATDGAAAEGP